MKPHFQRLLTNNRVFKTYWSWLTLLFLTGAIIALVQGRIVLAIVGLFFAGYTALVIAAAVAFGRGTFINVLRVIGLIIAHSRIARARRR